MASLDNSLDDLADFLDKLLHINAVFRIIDELNVKR